jgi:hypothetical protein
LESSLFQAVAQVNPTVQNTLLLLTALCSFLAISFINFFFSHTLIGLWTALSGFPLWEALLLLGCIHYSFV